jgi:hypothetical protein
MRYSALLQRSLLLSAVGGALINGVPLTGKSTALYYFT